MKQQELLKSQTDASAALNSNSSNEELVTRKAVPGTPFILVGTEETGYMITLGRYQVTKRYQHPEEAEEAVYEKTWEMLMGVMYALIQDEKLEAETIAEIQEIPQG